jgi:hypothetical protein
MKVGCPEKSAKNCHYTPRNFLKSADLIYFVAEYWSQSWVSLIVNVQITLPLMARRLDYRSCDVDMTDGFCALQNMLGLFRFVQILTLYMKPLKSSKFSN